MVLAELIREAKSLAVDEQLKLISELCDNFDPDGIPVDDAEVLLVQERVRRLETHPEDEMDWDQFEALMDAHLA